MDSFMANSENVMQIYDTASPYIWWLGQALLWLAALISLYTAYQLLTGQVDVANDA